MKLKILPFERILLRSPLPISEVYTRLANEVAPRPALRDLFNSQTSGSLFEGQIRGPKFEITRTINYRNSFLPLISGELIDHGSHTDIALKMKLHGFVKLFLAIWITGVSLGCVAVIVSVIMAPGDQPPVFALITPFIMLAVGYLMPKLAFEAESRKAKKLLTDLSGAHEVSDY